MSETAREEDKTASATSPPEDWKKSFNPQEGEEIELSIKSVNEFSQELEKIRAAMKNRGQ